jgi:hypothetical protein
MLAWAWKTCPSLAILLLLPCHTEEEEERKGVALEVARISKK